LARLEKVELPSSKLKVRMAEILESEGYVKGHRVVGEGIGAKLEVDLRYDGDKKLAIRNVARVSRPGRRVYARCDEIPKVKNGLGICIVSTSKGLMTDREARKLRVGGELVCEIW
jgi:small subunit ribosomal protein S8